ncbi:MAG: glycoside hydrolase family 140 protein [Paenibacillaceae bacterium]
MHIFIALLLVLMLLPISSHSDIHTDKHLPRLTISSNGKFITNVDGNPFFWLGDTAWELPHRLNRAEVRSYLESSVEHGINVIQIVALAELDGLTVANAQGDLPLTGKDPAKPLTTSGNNPAIEAEYDYWDHLDYVIETADSLGIYVALLPSWGEYLWDNRGQPSDPIFNTTNATQYGGWLGARYKDQDNIIWVLGGDRIPDSEQKLTIIRNMADGLNSAGSTQLKTYHPWGGKSSSEYFHEDEWLDFNSFQSGHTMQNNPNYNLTNKDYAKKNPKPTIDIESRYEQLPINFNPENGFFDGYDARQAAYWSVFAGAFGHTYGHNSLWQMYEADKTATIHASIYWDDALDATGKLSLQWLRKLIEARPILARVPDQTLITDALTGEDRVTGTRGEDYAFIYSSTGKAFTVNMGKISGNTVKTYWYNPRKGTSVRIGEYKNSGKRTFTPPSNGRGNDWVLVMDDSSKGYARLQIDPLPNIGLSSVHRH